MLTFSQRYTEVCTLGNLNEGPPLHFGKRAISRLLGDNVPVTQTRGCRGRGAGAGGGGVLTKHASCGSSRQLPGPGPAVYICLEVSAFILGNGSGLARVASTTVRTRGDLVPFTLQLLTESQKLQQVVPIAIIVY